MTKEQLWQAVLGELELSLSKANFTTWFKNTFIIFWDEKEEVIIGVPNTFTQAWLEKKYHKEILKALQRITNNLVKKVSYKVENIQHYKKIQTEMQLSGMKGSEIQESLVKLDQHGLNPNYTFARFIVGKNNELAYAACKSVTEKSTPDYNPIFIYSGVGLGKTHLLQATGHELLKQRPTKKVLYVSCEKFTNDFVRAIQERRMTEFKSRYRNVDALLVDDIQFMTGKEGTQEEFFHTFNELYQKRKPIIISSDRLPKSIPTLEERLISRFEQGLIADISKPDLETRQAILEAKSREKSYVLSDDIIRYLAANIQTNVRELEGALNKVIAYHKLYNLKPTLDSTKSILSTLKVNPQKKALTCRQIINVVADFYNLKPKEIISKTRRKEIALPRQIAMYLMREELDVSYPTIGLELGKRDHTTVIHAYRKISKEVNLEGRIHDEIEMIKQRLYNT